MARRKAVEEVTDLTNIKPATNRKKRESKGVTIYRVVPSEHFKLQEGVSTMHLLDDLGNEKDFKSAVKTVQTLTPGDFAIGRLRFVSLEEQTVKKTVLVRK